MKNKAPLFVGVAVLLAVLFVLSFAITKKTVTDKQKEQETVSSEESSETTTEGTSNESQAGADVSNDSTEAEGTSAVPESNSAPVNPTVISMPSDDTWSLVLLNKYYKMNDSYEPVVDKISPDSSIYLDSRVLVKFKEMCAAAATQGVTLTAASGYITSARQQRKFEKQVETYVSQGMSENEAISKTVYTVLPAGCSESNYGLAVDIGWLDEDFSGSPMYTWLRENAAAYGFVERYKSTKTDITKHAAEPWHWRYVGVDAAKEMVEKGVCLEEYVGKVN